MTELTPFRRALLRNLNRKHPDTCMKLFDGRTIEKFSDEEAADLIDKIKKIHGYDKDGNAPTNPYRPNSMRYRIADTLINNNMDKDKTYDILEPELNTEGFTYGENRNGRRVPAPLDKQKKILKQTISTVHDALTKGEQSEEDPNEEYRRGVLPNSHMTANDYLSKIRSLRKFCADRAASGQPIDEISMRPVEYGAKMIREGIPPEACLYALTAHWPDEVRKAAEIKKYNPEKLAGKHKDGTHKLMGYIIKLAKARIPIALYGPKGTGKTYLAGQLAKELGLKFGMVPMTAGATPSWLVGAYTLDGYKTRPFIECYRDGGVFLFDEMDAADPNMLLVVNSALANGWFYNPVTGEAVKQHEDFIPVACMNTLGLGANRHYTGRERLDAATLDRWNMGRVQLNVDEKLEEYIYNEILKDTLEEMAQLETSNN